MVRLDKTFSQEWDIYTILTNELRLASLHDLQTIYNVEDAYDMLEIIEAHTAIAISVRKEQDQAAK